MGGNNFNYQLLNWFNEFVLKRFGLVMMRKINHTYLVHQAQKQEDREMEEFQKEMEQFPGIEGLR